MRDLTEAYKLIRQFEGCKLHSYQDSVGVWTIGFGTTVGVHPGMAISLAQAESLMEIDVQHRASQIGQWVHAVVNDNQMSAMISLAYNIGMGAFYHSRLLTDVNAGVSKKTCAQDFMSWTHAGGHILQGLVNRRRQEMAIFLT